jgi:hypothetical protein
LVQQQSIPTNSISILLVGCHGHQVFDELSASWLETRVARRCSSVKFRTSLATRRRRRRREITFGSGCPALSGRKIP